jgi:predicted enzyme related to lactoylglutathione lyase
MAHILLNLDVDDVARAVRFYTEAFGLRIGRRFTGDFVELLGAQAPIYLLPKAAASPPYASAESTRSYSRHWTPVHLDFVVEDIDAAIARAVAAGANLEQPAQQQAYGLLALLSDPFGHGFCFLQFTGKGYDELPQVAAGSQSSLTGAVVTKR